jgi:Ni,Fe-hydrogenase III small subunit/formate hydrogenlyase subunit 6/NADH:ubiquinone oxidoreductase subunit I
MLKLLRERLRQGRRTLAWPKGEAELPARYRGRPELMPGFATVQWQAWAAASPTGALTVDAEGPRLDLGACLFADDLEPALAAGAIRYTRDYRLAARRREDLLIRPGEQPRLAASLEPRLRRLFARSLRIRQLCAGGSGADEAEVNVLTTVVFDLARFGVQVVASPRHADALLVTGPVTRNMSRALELTWEAMPAPKLVIAAGTEAISGGIFAGSPEVVGGVERVLPVDLYIPGFPAHPLTVLDGILRLLGRIDCGPTAPGPGS